MPHRLSSPLGLALLNALGLAGVLIVNVLANALPMNGVTTAEVSAEFPNLFVPAGWTFAIWGLIYLLLIGFSGFALFRAAITKTGEAYRAAFLPAIGPWFFISCLANMAWILAWHHRLLAMSVALMCILLFSLIAIYRRLYIGRVVHPLEKVLVHLPFSVYLGWITVATVANLAAFFVHHGWHGAPLPEPAWAGGMILVAAGLGAIQLRRNRDLGYAAVLVWAFAGIAANRVAVSGNPSDPVRLTAMVAGIGLTGVAILTLLKRPAHA